MERQTEQGAEQVESATADTTEDVRAVASKALMGRTVKVTPEMTGLTGARSYLLRITRVDVASATSGLVHVYGEKLRLDGTPSREKRPSKAATFMPGWKERLESTEGRPRPAYSRSVSSLRPTWHRQPEPVRTRPPSASAAEALLRDRGRAADDVVPAVPPGDAVLTTLAPQP